MTCLVLDFQTSPNRYCLRDSVFKSSFEQENFFPLQNYTYSVPNQVEMILSLIKKLDLDSAHVVAYGMSVPLVEEILARRDRGVLPERFNTFFKVDHFKNNTDCT